MEGRLSVVRGYAEPVVIVCPECRLRGDTGNCNLGNRRAYCGTCNRWAQNLRRRTLDVLAREVGPTRLEQLQRPIIRDLYAKLVYEFEESA